MRLIKKMQTGGYVILSKKADNVIIKSIDIKQRTITCDLVKGDPETDNCETLATDRYFYFDLGGAIGKNIPFGDLTANDIKKIRRLT